LRERIRNERAIELMFENHRWHDLRRWMIAEEVFKPVYPIRGVIAYCHHSSTTATWRHPNDVFTYRENFITTEIRVFERKHYWYPIGKDEAMRMTQFQQNPGW
ncbi:MAG: RagB/SusD family nutrient uptake outer membrane protein, partial [Tannerella sp.]|nr:RagB/SusD family nutrient uptake outer membrane protein [Tannerella sp.]